MAHGCPGISGYRSEVLSPKGQRSFSGPGCLLKLCLSCFCQPTLVSPCGKRESQACRLPWAGSFLWQNPSVYWKRNTPWLRTCHGGIPLPVSWGYPSIPVQKRAVLTHRNIQVFRTRPRVMGSLNLVLWSHLSITCNVSQAQRNKAFPDEFICYSKFPLTGDASSVHVFQKRMTVLSLGERETLFLSNYCQQEPCSIYFCSCTWLIWDNQRNSYLIHGSNKPIWAAFCYQLGVSDVFRQGSPSFVGRKYIGELAAVGFPPVLESQITLLSLDHLSQISFDCLLCYRQHLLLYLAWKAREK